MHQLARTSYKLACTSQRLADASAMFDLGGMASPVCHGASVDRNVQRAPGKSTREVPMLS